MPRYFNKFPKLLYTKDNNTSLVTNLLIRVDTIKERLNNMALFYTYDIREGETPEMIASKYYNDAELHWVVLMFNDMYDPFYDWPMHYQQFQSYIITKYGDVAAAMATNHHYEKIVSTIDGYSGETTKNTYNIDLSSYTATIAGTITKTFPNGQTVTVTTSKRAVDAYMYEDELNESKRTIKLIKNDLIPDIKKQFDYLMSV
jgi:hypothetical protein